MRWFRDHRQSATAAALFALILQFALSFGHVHGPASVAKAAQGIAELARVEAGEQPQALSQPALPGPRKPGAPHQQHSTDDLCAICIATGFLASAQAVAPPAVPSPSGVVTAILTRTETAASLAQARFAFRSRAPPQA